MILVGLIIIGGAVVTGFDFEYQIVAFIMGGLLIIFGWKERAERARTSSGYHSHGNKPETSFQQSGNHATRPYNRHPKLEDITSPDGYIGYKESLMNERPVTPYIANTVEEIINLAKEVIDKDGALAFRYEKSSGEVSERRVEPLDIYRGYQDRLYLKAYDFLRDEERTFRLDRMSGVRLEE